MPVKMDAVMVRIVIRMHSGAWPAPSGLQLHYGYGHGEGMVVGKQEALQYEVNILEILESSEHTNNKRVCESRSFGDSPV